MRTLLFVMVLLVPSFASFAAQLQVPEQFDLLRVNGEEHKTFFQRNKSVALKIGRNEIELEFNQIYDADNGDSHDRIRSSAFVIVIEVNQANEIWQLLASMPANRKEAVHYAKAPIYTLQLNGVDVVKDANAASSNATNRPSSSGETSDENALTMLHAWWAKASAEQRQEFLNSVLSNK